MPICIIHNGRFAYTLVVDANQINFQGSDAAEYFEKHYHALGYDVKRTGNGETDWKSGGS